MKEPVLRRLALTVPYLAVVLGLFVARNAWGGVLGYHAAMVLLLSAARAWPLARRFSVPISAPWAAGMLGAGLASGVGLYLLWSWLGIDPRLGELLAGLGLTSTTWLPFIAYFLLVNPWLEELYWRGWLGSPSRQPTAGDVCFGGYHLFILAPYVAWAWLVPFLLPLSGAAWLWRQIVRRNNSLLAPAFFHLAADASILVTIYLHVR